MVQPSLMICDLQWAMINDLSEPYLALRTCFHITYSNSLPFAYLYFALIRINFVVVVVLLSITWIIVQQRCLFAYAAVVFMSIFWWAYRGPGLVDFAGLLCLNFWMIFFDFFYDFLDFLMIFLWLFDDFSLNLGWSFSLTFQWFVFEFWMTYLEFELFWFQFKIMFFEFWIIFLKNLNYFCFNFEWFLRRGAPFLNSYVFPLLSSSVCLSHFLFVWENLTSVSERYIFANIF